MTPEQKKLLFFLSECLFFHPSSSPVPDDIRVEATKQGVLSLITLDHQTVLSNIRIIVAHRELTDVLKPVPFTTIKGFASARYYPNPSLRTMGDVDFYTDSVNYPHAVERLFSAGYKQIGKKHKRHVTFSKKNIVFELHAEIKGIPNGMDGIPSDSLEAEKRIRGFISDLVESATLYDSPQYGKILVPDDFHHGLIMLLHIAGHMFNDGGIDLRRLCDWAVYVDKVHLPDYSSHLKAAGLWTFACQLTALCSEYLGLKKQPWAGEWSQFF